MVDFFFARVNTAKALIFVFVYGGFLPFPSCIFSSTVTENISEAHNVFLQAVIRAREKMTEIVGKDLLFRHVRHLA